MTSKSSTQPRNLLPNASFELPFGQEKHAWTRYNPGEGAPDNWTDMFNPLTIQLHAAGQVPVAAPVIQEVDGAPDGGRAVAISFSEGKPGHLTSPVVSLKPGQAYTLSVYARSDVPSAKLHLCMWNRPANWNETPDAQSEELPLSKQWQRYQLTFNVAFCFRRGLVDLVATADTGGKLWVDAVQLEEGPRATPFEARYPVEVALTADKPFSGTLYLMGEPLEINLLSYSSRQQHHPGNLKLSIETFDGKEVFSEDISCPTVRGSSKNKLSLNFPLVGNFRARVFSAAGQNIDVSSYGYIFTVHPVMKCGFGFEKTDPEKEDFQGILYSRDGEVHELPAERIRLPLYSGESMWNFTVTAEKLIYLMAVTAKNEFAREIMRSGDGGRKWDVLKVTRPVQSVLPDGSLLNWAVENNWLVLYRSRDEGKTWESLGRGPGPFPSDPQTGRILQLRDGTLVWPIGHERSGVNHAVYAYRSTDQGKTWSEGYPICPTGEPSIIELASGRLLATVRNNLMPKPDAWPICLDDEHEVPWRLWMMQYGMAKGNILTSVNKNVLLADSDDGGVTWTNVRAGSTLLEEMHGSSVELPDGRIVLIHVHRLPWLHGGERARVSRDGGNTWEKETYYLSTVLTYPEYSTNCVLPPELADGKPGMILSVLGDRPFAVNVDRPGLMQAVRWRPLP